MEVKRHEMIQFKVDVYHHFQQDTEGVILTRIAQLEKTVMVKQTEIATGLGEVGTKLDKIAGETQSLVDKVAELGTQIDALGDASPELVAAFEAVKGKAEAVDAKVADIAPNPPPATEPPAEPPAPT